MNPASISRESRSLQTFSKIAARLLVVLFAGSVLEGTASYFSYILKHPQPITDTIPWEFPVIVQRLTAVRNGHESVELVSWTDWQKEVATGQQGSPLLLQRNRSGAGRLPYLFYSYHATEDTSGSQIVLVSMTDYDDVEIRARYRVDGDTVIPLAYRRIHGSMVINIAPVAFIATLLFTFFLRALLRQWARYTGAEHEVLRLARQYDVCIAPP